MSQQKEEGDLTSPHFTSAHKAKKKKNMTMSTALSPERVVAIVFIEHNFETPLSRQGRIISCVNSLVTFRDRTLLLRPDGPIVVVVIERFQSQ